MKMGWNQVLILLLFALLGFTLPKSSLAQTLTLQMKAEEGGKASHYQLEILPHYQKPTADSDGLIRTRARMKFYFLTIPDCYKKSDKRIPTGDTLLDKPILGAKLEDYSNPKNYSLSSLSNEFFNTNGELCEENETSKDGTCKKNSLNKRFHNVIRKIIPRETQTAASPRIIGQNDMKYAALPCIKSNTNTLCELDVLGMNNELVFAYGDSLLNARRAREIGFYGVNSFDFSDIDLKALNQGKNKFIFVSDPSDSESKDTAEINEQNVRKYGLWHFDFYDVGTVRGHRMPYMAEIWVEWIVEAVIDVKNPPKGNFPVITMAAEIPKVAKAGESKGEAAKDQNGSVQSPSSGGNIFQLLGFSNFDTLTKGLPSSGIPIVAGYGIKNDGPGTMFAYQIKDPDPGTKLLGDVKDLLSTSGYLLGVTSGNRSSAVLALTRRLGSRGQVFFGGAFREASGITRASPVVGLAFSVNPLLNGTEEASVIGKEVSIEVKSVPLYHEPCLQSQNEAVVWHRDLKTNESYVQENSKQNLKDWKMPTAQFGQTEDSGDILHDERLGFNVDSNWITWVLPGKLLSVYPGIQSDGTPVVNEDQLKLTNLSELPHGTLPFDRNHPYPMEAGNIYFADFTDQTELRPRVDCKECTPTDPMQIKYLDENASGASNAGRTQGNAEEGGTPVADDPSADSPSAPAPAEPRERLASLKPLSVLRSAPARPVKTVKGLKQVQAKKPAVQAAPRSGVGLKGILSPPAGVKIDQIRLEILTDDGQATVAFPVVSPNGRFYAPGIRPGAYRLRISIPGRKTYERKVTLTSSSEPLALLL